MLLQDNIPEAILAKELGMELVFGIGRGGKVQSSSWLTANDRETKICFCGSGLLYKDCHGASVGSINTSV